MDNSKNMDNINDAHYIHDTTHTNDIHNINDTHRIHDTNNSFYNTKYEISTIDESIINEEEYHDLYIKQNALLSTNSIIDVKIKENYCSESSHILLYNLINYKSSLLTLQNTYIQYNLTEKNKDNSNKIEKINELLNIMCDHEWIEDYIDYPDGEGSYKIVYCSNCELNKDN